MLEKEKEKAIQREVLAAIRRSQELQSDFIGFGDLLYRKYPDTWEKIKSDWRSAWLPGIEVDVKVTSKLERTGNTIDPVPVRMD